MANKRKPVPELWDHNKKKTSARTFTRVGNSNSIAIHSTQVLCELQQDHVIIQHPSLEFTPPHDNEYPTNHDEGFVPTNPDSTESAGIKVKVKQRYQNTVRVGVHLLPAVTEVLIHCFQDAPLTTWVKDFRTASLDERMRYEGRGEKHLGESCPDCSCPGSGTVRCEDCFGRELLCRSCCIKRHHRLPLHRIKVSNVNFCSLNMNLKLATGMERRLLHINHPARHWLASAARRAPRAWDLMHVQARGPQRLCCPSHEWHPCPQCRLMWLQRPQSTPNQCRQATYACRLVSCHAHRTTNLFHI